MAWWQLTKRSEIDGTARDAGYLFFRPDGWEAPPVDTVRNPDDATQWIDVPAAVLVPDDVVERMSLNTTREGTAAHGYPRGDDDVVRPMLADDWLAEREKIDAQAAESAAAPVAPLDEHGAAMVAKGEREAEQYAGGARPADDHATAGQSASSDTPAFNRTPPEPLPPATNVEQQEPVENVPLPVVESRNVRQDEAAGSA